ncbi:MAG: AAA family ATPase, partial [Verrucomicrobiae bacterium]|nr:AAA family ATPase [Verrucomicrobiae bacterium]
MDLNQFTEKAAAAWAEAQNIATRRQHQALDVEHLLRALIDQEGGLAAPMLERAGVSPNLLRSKLDSELAKIPQVSVGDGSPGGAYVTQRLNRLLVRAQDEAKKLKDEYVSVEHLILAALEEPASSPAGRIFKELGV